MMAVLAIDTSSDYLSLALEVNGKRFSSLDQVGNKQSQFILQKIDTLLQEANILPHEVNVIAYIEGPGSFTGLRIGLSVALGLSYGANARLIAIPAFALYARAANSNDVLVGIDARLGQIYLAGMNSDTLDYFILPQVIDPDKIVIDKNVLLIGNGFHVYHDRLNNKLRQCKLLDLTYPSALHMLDIVQLNKYPLLLPAQANLAYLRNKVALKLEEQQNQKNKLKA